MANYPTANPSFTTKNPGGTIAASHINAVQDEVVAIGTALRTTLQHGLSVSTGGLTVSTGSVNLGGPSSVQTLQVNGGSTFAGAIAAGSTGVTFGAVGTPFKEGYFSSLYVAGVPIGAATPTVKVTHSGNTALSTTGERWVGLSWDTEEYDSVGMHSTASNSSRLTFANSTGIYHVGGAVVIHVDNQIECRARLVLNDSTTILAAMVDHTAAGASTVSLLNVSADLRVQSTADYVTLQVMTNGNSTASVRGNSTSGATAFWAHRISA